MVMAVVEQSFYYPDQPGRPKHRMCAAGQRRAAKESLRLLQEDQTGVQDPEVTEILTRGGRALNQLQRGIPTNKHKVISAVVAGAYANGELQNYVNLNGDFILETYDGTQLRRNIREEEANGKQIY